MRRQALRCAAASLLAARASLRSCSSSPVAAAQPPPLSLPLGGGSRRSKWTAHAPSETSRRVFDVYRVSPGSSKPELLEGRAASLLGVHDRDAPLFTRTSFCSQPATFSWRPDGAVGVGAGGGALYLHFDPFRAVLRRGECILFDAHRTVVAAAAERACREPAVAAGDSALFPSVVLERLLTDAGAHTRGRLSRLCAAVEATLEAINESLRRGGDDGASSGGEAFARLVPLTRALTALSSDVAENVDALTHLAADEHALAALGGASVDAVAASLRAARAVSGELRELQLHLLSTREAWELQLDGQRNRVQSVLLRLNAAAVALSCASLPAALLGMNVANGLEAATPRAFVVLSVAAAAAGGAAFAAALSWARAAGSGGAAGKRKSAEDARAVASVLDGLELIEDVLRTRPAGLARANVLTTLRASCPGRFDGAGDAEVALLYRIFDTNKDGKLTLAEVARAPPPAAEAHAAELPWFERSEC